MGIFHKKDDFGRTIYRIPIGSILGWVFFIALIVFVLISACKKPVAYTADEDGIFEEKFLNNSNDNDLRSDGDLDFTEEINTNSDKSDINEPTDKELKIIDYKYRIVKRFNKKLYATCYSQFDGPVEMKGIYANQKFADLLHIQERRIQRHHYTVAINPEMRRYHEELIELPGGVWTHKYRVHVPGYNSSELPASKHNKGYLTSSFLLSMFNADYFSVPRDRMKWKGRIDVLFTTAGRYATIKERQRYWAKKDTHNLPCEIWEIQKIAVYSDGSEKVIK